MVRRRGAAAILLGLALAGCATRPIAQMTLVTTRPGAVAVENLRSEVVGTACTTRDVVRATLTPPWRAQRANPAHAVARALDAVPGADVLTDVTLRVRVEQYLLFQRVCAIAIGNAGRMR